MLRLVARAPVHGRISALNRAQSILTHSGDLSLHQRHVRAGDDARGWCRVIALAIADREGVPELTPARRTGRIARVVADRAGSEVARLDAIARACADRTGSVIARGDAIARACADRTASVSARRVDNARACADCAGVWASVIARVVAITRAVGDLRWINVEARVGAGACGKRCRCGQW